MDCILVVICGDLVGICWSTVVIPLNLNHGEKGRSTPDFPHLTTHYLPQTHLTSEQPDEKRQIKVCDLHDLRRSRQLIIWRQIKKVSSNAR